MENKSIMYKLGEKITTIRIKRCGKWGHRWQSHGTVRTCKSCGKTESPTAGHYFDRYGQELECTSRKKITQENCANYGHVFSNQNPTKCVVCGVVR